MNRATRSQWFLAIALTVVANVLILGFFYERFCWPPDDGHYAHLAERILDGEIVHRDIEDFHTDNSHVVNVAALALFGRELRSLRIPLAIVTFAQSIGLLWIFRSRSPRTAVTAAVALTSLSFVQYLNPQPHWYCLALTVASVGLLTRPGPRGFSQIASLGFLVGATFLFRQLTGVFLGMGILAYLLAVRPSGEAVDQPRLGSRIALLVVAAVLLVYCLRTTNVSGFLLFGVWPVLLLGWSARHTRSCDRELARIVAALTTGAVLAAVPTVLYHAAHGSLVAWLHDCFSSALRVETLPYLHAYRYTDFLRSAVEQMSSGHVANSLLSNAYWLLLPALGVLNGIFLLLHLVRGPERTASGMALPFVAAFYGMVSLFNQIPMYLYYSVGLLAAGVLWTRTAGAKRRGSVWEPVLIAVSLVALFFHAGQPATRTLASVVGGERITLVRNTRIPRMSLWLEPRVIDTYAALLETIHRETGAGESIFVLPNHPEVYFLADRENPTWFPNTSLALRDGEDIARLLDIFRSDPPTLVVHAPRDRHNTATSEQVMRFVAQSYDRIAAIGEFVVYRRR